MTNVESVKTLGHDLYADILKNFPNAKVSPTIHKSFAHGLELIRLNDGFGLGMLSEEGLEGCNKILRRARMNLSRKCSQYKNLADCLKRLWRRSDPDSNARRVEIMMKCKQCHEIGHTSRSCRHKIENVMQISEGEKLFESYFK